MLCDSRKKILLNSFPHSIDALRSMLGKVKRVGIFPCSFFYARGEKTNTLTLKNLLDMLPVLTISDRKE